MGAADACLAYQWGNMCLGGRAAAGLAAALHPAIAAPQPQKAATPISRTVLSQTAAAAANQRELACPLQLR
jgi:hypothetical protein